MSKILTHENVTLADAVKKKKNIILYKQYSLKDYENNNNNVKLFNYKMQDLKMIAKENKLKVSGTKLVLINRICTHFKNIIHAVKIQKYFRGYMVRFLMTKRGPASKNKSLCVNETDGYTLEPLNEISFERFFSYKDKKNFIYGFDIISLLQVYDKKKKIMNPYTREMFDVDILNIVITLGKFLKILFPHCFQSEENNITQTPITNRVLQNSHFTNRENRDNRENHNQSMEFLYLTLNEEQKIIYDKLKLLKTMNIQDRIRNIFIEIDILGNYTNSFWFLQLERRELAKFLFTLYEIWNFRGRIPDEVKKQICQIHDPFQYTRLTLLTENNVERLREQCMNVMENMIYSGVNLEFRKLGCLHVLRALTIVSIPARNSMPWLYESLPYTI